MRENKLGKYIKDKRQEQKVTLRELAQNAGVSFSHLSKIERGEHSPTKETLEVLADALYLDKYELFLLAGYSPDADMIYWKEVYDNLKPEWGIDKDEFIDPTGKPDIVKFRNHMVHGKYNTGIHNKLYSYFLMERLKSSINEHIEIQSYNKVEEHLSELYLWEDMNDKLKKRGYTPEQVLELIDLMENMDYRFRTIKKSK